MPAASYHQDYKAPESHLAELFARASNVPCKVPEGYLTDEQRSNYYQKLKQSQINKGIRKFQRRTLGFFGKSSVKTLEELTDIFMDLNMTPTRQEALRIITNLDGVVLNYNLSQDSWGERDWERVQFTTVTDNKGKNALRIQWNFLYDTSLVPG